MALRVKMATLIHMSPTYSRNRDWPLRWLWAIVASVAAHLALAALVWLWQGLELSPLADTPAAPQVAEAEAPDEASSLESNEASAQPTDVVEVQERRPFEVVTIIETETQHPPVDVVVARDPLPVPEPELVPVPEPEPVVIPEPLPPEPEPAIAEPEPAEPEPLRIPEDMNRVSVDQVDYNDQLNLEAEFLAEQDNRVEQQTIAEDTVLFDEHSETQQAGDTEIQSEQAGAETPTTPAADTAAEVAGLVAGTTTASGSPAAQANNAAQPEPPDQEEQPAPGERSTELPREAVEERAAVVGQPEPAIIPPEVVPDEHTASAEIPSSDDGNVAQPQPASAPFEAFTAAAAAQRAIVAQQAIGSEGPLVRRVVEQGELAFQEVFGDRNARDRERISREVAEASLAGDHDGRWERTRGTLENFDVHVAAGAETALNTTSSPFAAYIHRLHNEIHPVWTGYLIRLSLSEGPGSPLSDQSLECTLEYVISREGEVADVRIVRQAREPMFTAEAVNMLYSLGPYPPPPAAMLSSDGNTYIHWRFQRDNRACGTFGASVHFLPGAGPVDEGK